MALADTARLVASLELQDKFSSTANKYDRTLGGMERRTSSAFGRIGSEVGRGIGQLSANLLKIGTIASGVVVGGIIASVNAASDLNEEIDKSKVVFGDASDEVIEFGKNAATIGLAASEALGAAGAFGNMFNTIGIAQDASADMSVTMVQLAADMASFNNEDPSEMLDRLRSGLSGEAEPLRRFGVLLSEASVKEFAYRTGIAETGDVLTEAQKVQARYGLILEQTAIQQGNFALTSKSIANQQRILRANLRNTAAILGTAFLPPLSRVAIQLNEVFVEKQPQITAFAERLGEGLERIFTDQNIEAGIDRIGGFIDRLSEGDTSGIFGQITGVISELSDLPWASIGDAARLLGTGSRALLDAFLEMPPWVQTAVLTGWGLNKLTGGALGNIVSSLASGLIKGILGINAGVVNLNAGVVNGGVPGAPGGAGGVGGGILGAVGRTAGLAGILAAIEGGILTLGDLQSLDARRQDQGVVTLTQGPVGLITRALEEVIGDPLGDLITSTKTLGTKTDQLYDATTSGARQAERDAVKIADQARTSTARQAEDAAKIHSDNARLLQTQAASLVPLQQIAAKPDPVTNVNVTSNVSITDITRRLVSFRISQGVRGGFTE